MNRRVHFSRLFTRVSTQLHPYALTRAEAVSHKLFYPVRTGKDQSALDLIIPSPNTFSVFYLFTPACAYPFAALYALHPE